MVSRVNFCEGGYTVEEELLMSQQSIYRSVSVKRRRGFGTQELNDSSIILFNILRMFMVDHLLPSSGHS